VNDRVPIPWWQIATVELLGIAIAIAIAKEPVWDALIIGFLLLVGLILVERCFYVCQVVIGGPCSSSR
jgi:uncharacterized membrane protein HdeD (DUF308 family)